MSREISAHHNCHNSKMNKKKKTIKKWVQMSVCCKKLYFLIYTKRKCPPFFFHFYFYDNNKAFFLWNKIFFHGFSTEKITNKPRKNSLNAFFKIANCFLMISKLKSHKLYIFIALYFIFFLRFNCIFYYYYWNFRCKQLNNFNLLQSGSL